MSDSTESTVRDSDIKIEQARASALEHIFNEIHFLEYACSIWMNIGENANTLRDSSHNGLFGLFQKHAFDSIVLSLSKLFEKPSKRYPNHSIRTVLMDLDEENERLTMNSSSSGFLAQYLSDDKQKQRELMGDEKGMIKSALNRLKDECPRADKDARDDRPLDQTLKRLKHLRDKKVAHFERIELDSEDLPTWNDIKDLIAFAKVFHNIVARKIFGFSTETKVRRDDPDLINPEYGREVQKLINSLGLEKKKSASQ